MANTEEHWNSNAKFGCRGPRMMHGPRSCNLGFGIMLTLAGTIWLATKMGWVVPDLIWPAAVLAAGMAIVTLTLTRGGKSRNDDRPGREV